MAATAIQTVLIIQRMAAGAFSPAASTMGLPSSEKYWLNGIVISQSGAFSLLMSVS
jgi:hypothetical protein